MLFRLIIISSCLWWEPAVQPDIHLYYNYDFLVWTLLQPYNCWWDKSKYLIASYSVMFHLILQIELLKTLMRMSRHAFLSPSPLLSGHTGWNKYGLTVFSPVIPPALVGLKPCLPPQVAVALWMEASTSGFDLKHPLLRCQSHLDEEN